MKIADLGPVLLPTKIRQVNSSLYRGSAIYSPIKALRVKNRGVQQVIDLRHENGIFVKFLKTLEKIYCKLLKMDYVEKSFYQNNEEILPNMDYFEDLLKQINNGKKTYIHCHFGKHRTGFAVAMYQKKEGIDNNTIIRQLLSCDWKTEFQQRNIALFLEKFLN